MLRLSLTLAALAAGPAQAALECQYYDEMVQAAAMVMQVGEVEVRPPPVDSDQCTLRGTILRSFKGPHPVGTRIETRVACLGYPLAAGQEEVLSIGATVYWDYPALRDAAVVELHIAPEGGPAGAGAGIVILDAPTDAPAWTPTCD